MIYTITPNPALDLGGKVDNLVPNEKAYVTEETRFPGGNAINAARIIKKMNQPVLASGFLGGAIGNQIEQLLEKEGVSCDFIPIQGETRINITVSDQKTHLQTRLSFPGPKLRRNEVQSMTRWISNLPHHSLLLIGGSVPPGLTPSDLKRWIQAAHSKDIACIVDCPGQVLSKLISARPLLIKPNLAEFQELTHSNVHTLKNVLKVARKMTSQIPMICVSSVEGGALLVTENEAYWGQVPKIKVKTTVGAGDSMVGAMAAQIWKLGPLAGGGQIDELLRWGLASAAATLATTGTHLGEYPQIQAYYPKIKIKKLTH
jgi:1-phosphofructokinase family hexose kinase